MVEPCSAATSRIVRATGESRARHTAARGSACRCRGWEDAELFEHRQPVKHQVEGDVLAVAEAEHLDVIHRDRAAGGRDVPGRTVQDALVGSGEGSFLNGDISGDVQVVDLDVRVGEGFEPAGEELSAGRLSLTGHPAWSFVDDIIGEHTGEPVD